MDRSWPESRGGAQITKAKPSLNIESEVERKNQSSQKAADPLLSHTFIKQRFHGMDEKPSNRKTMGLQMLAYGPTFHLEGSALLSVVFLFRKFDARLNYSEIWSSPDRTES